MYGQLFQQADSEKLGVVTGDVAVKFFERTKLDPVVLGEVDQSQLLGESLPNESSRYGN